ncbi:MAG: DNA replication/repair protein RecF [Pseudomonadales bacterium]
MAFINRVVVADVRNIRNATLEIDKPINLIYGSNGSGKTSLLECFHILALGRSFRGTRIKPVINHDAQHCVIYGEVTSLAGRNSKLGIKKALSGDTLVRMDGETARNLSELAKKIPLQVLNSDGFLLLTGSPKLRRQMLDWGVFHVEHSFLELWRRLQRALKQRNSLLRRDRIAETEISPWNREIIEVGTEIDGLRQSYLTEFEPIFQSVLATLSDAMPPIRLSYYKGWDTKSTLAEVFDKSRSRDEQLGYTQFGPHRADMRLKTGGYNAGDILSRGQQKLVVAALRLSQGKLLEQLAGEPCVYLIDDLPAELDARHRIRLINLLLSMNCQSFITGVDKNELLAIFDSPSQVAVFHVEHGQINEDNS